MTTNVNFDINYSKLTINKMFQNMYIVPDYQREYVWNEPQVEQLLTDLINAFDDNDSKAYFMGMIVVYSDGSTKYELIDGQQRITTFFLLVCAFIQFYKENNESASHMQKRLNDEDMDDNGLPINNYALELQYSKSTDVLDAIYNNKISEALIDSLPDGSDKRLYLAYKTIRMILKSTFTDVDGFNFDEFKRFVVYVWNKVQLVQIESNDMSDALKIFETINQRGVGLNSLDLLKNMIFMQIDREDFKKLNMAWKDMMDELLKVEKKPLRFLRYFITSNYDITNPNTGVIKGILAEDKIYEWISNNDSQCHYTNHPFEFMDILSKSVKKYIEYLKPNPVTVGNEYLINIPRIAGSSYKSHMVLLLAADKMDINALVKFKQLLESLIFYTMINGIKGNETEKLFANWAPLIRKIQNTDDLKVFAVNTLKPQILKWSSEKNFKQRFLDLNLSSIQKYRVKYILARIGKYIDEFRSNGTNFADIENYCAKNIEIEHIMPQECLDFTSYGIKNEEEFMEYVTKLGNLTLLEKTFNSSCKNKLFEQKKPFYSGSQFYLSSSIFSLTAVGVNNAAVRMDQKLKAWMTWDKESIEERQKMLYDIACEIWDVDQIMKKW